MKKLIAAIIVVLMTAMVLTSCGKTDSASSVSDGQESEEQKENETSKKKPAKKEDKSKSSKKQSPAVVLDKKDLDITDFPWEAGPEIDGGDRIYALSIENNSEYPILGVEISYTVKDDVEDEQLEIFNDFREEHSKFIDADEDNRNVTLRGFTEAFVPTGARINRIGLAIGFKDWSWYDMPNAEQYALMEPDILTLLLVKENHGFIAYYDCKNQVWSVEDTKKEYSVWPETRFTQMIPQPECELFLVTSAEDSSFLSVHAYGVDSESFSAYTEAVKESGFTADPFETDSHYSAETEDGYSISFSWSEEDNVMSINLDEP